MSLFRRLKSQLPLLGRASRRSTVELALPGKPFFELAPPWWTRWTWFFVAGNAAFTLVTAIVSLFTTKNKRLSL